VVGVILESPPMDREEPMTNPKRVEQMTDVYDVPCDVHHVRTFRTGREMGVGYPLRQVGTWFVYDRGSATDRWHMHCGPYSSFDQAAAWIHDIRDRPDIVACSNCGGSGSLPDMTCCRICGGGGKVLR
jgi:hypothetical protein